MYVTIICLLRCASKSLPEIESYETVMENVVRPQIFFIYLHACYVIAKAILPSFWKE